jgi:hypothetical protein
MVFTILFLLWTGVLLSALLAQRTAAMSAFGVMLVLSLLLFAHHVTDPLTLSF